MSIKHRKEASYGYVYKYKDAFSLRDEIGTCLNIEIEIDVTDKYSFFIMLYYYEVKEEDKDISGKEMKKLVFQHILVQFW